MAGEYDADYAIVKVDLAVVTGKSQVEIVQDGRPIAGVTINTLPVAAVGHVFLRFGVNGDPIPLRQEAFSLNRTPPRSNGIFLDVDAGQAGILILLISIDTGLLIQA